MEKKIFLGISIRHLSYDKFVQNSIDQKSGYSCFLNSHMLYEHYNNPSFEGVLDNANYIVPDGVPILYLLRLFKKRRQERIAGNDVIFSLIEKAKVEKLSIFIFGATDQVLKKISSNLTNIGVKHWTYSPPFTGIDNFDLNSQSDKINKIKPDMVLVGLGCPKQEIWMYKMKNQIKAPMYGLGGAFLLFAGIDNRAPKWMRSSGMEWAYRLTLEPKRLFKRYLITNSFFIWLVFKEIFKSNK